jgi:hypothetical protein
MYYALGGVLGVMFVAFLDYGNNVFRDKLSEEEDRKCCTPNCQTAAKWVAPMCLRTFALIGSALWYMVHTTGYFTSGADPNVFHVGRAMLISSAFFQGMSSTAMFIDTVMVTTHSDDASSCFSPQMANSFGSFFALLIVWAVLLATSDILAIIITSLAMNSVGFITHLGVLYMMYYPEDAKNVTKDLDKATLGLANGVTKGLNVTSAKVNVITKKLRGPKDTNTD